MAAMLDPDHLRTFVAIAETGSFTRAADIVAKTQSAVSMQMRRLEERVGRPIFERDGRMSRLTADGERLLPQARRIMKMQAETLAMFTEEDSGGVIRLGTPDDYAAFLPVILGQFAASRPLMEITVVCAPTHDLIQSIENDELDIAIITHLPGDSRNTLIVRREPLVWVTSERHHVHEETPLPLALGSPQCDWRQSAISGLTAMEREHRVAFSSWNVAAVSAAVESGLAVSVLPESAVRPGMRILHCSDGFPRLPACEIGVLRSPRNDSPTANELTDYVVSSLSRSSSSSVQAA